MKNIMVPIIDTILTLIIMGMVVGATVIFSQITATAKSKPSDRFEFVSRESYYAGFEREAYIIRDKKTDREYITNGQFFTLLEERKK